MKNQEYIESEMNAVISEIVAAYPETTNFETVYICLDSEDDGIDISFSADALKTARNEFFQEDPDVHVIAVVSLPKPLVDKMKGKHTAHFNGTRIETTVSRKCQSLGRDGVACDNTECPSWKPWGNFAGTLKKGYFCSGLLPEVIEDDVELSPECPQSECERLEYGDLSLCKSCHLRKGYCSLERSFE